MLSIWRYTLDRQKKALDNWKSENTVELPKTYHNYDSSYLTKVVIPDVLVSVIQIIFRTGWE